MPVLWKVLNNATKAIIIIIIGFIEKYSAQENWRWEPQSLSLTISNDSQKHICASNVNPPKKGRLQDIADSDIHSSSCEEKDFSGSDTDSDDVL